MPRPERSVLHVLPHPGGGGETYVDLLGAMPEYRFERVYLAPSPTPSPSDLGRGLVAAIRRAGRHDLLHIHGEVASGLCLPLLATRPSVVTWHGLNLVRRLSGLRRRAAALNLHAILHAADVTICVSESERAELLRSVGPRPSHRAVVVRNGVSLVAATGGAARQEVRAELGIADSEPVAIWVGSLDEPKDPLAAIRAAERAEVTLLVIGDGRRRAPVEQAANERIRVLGQRADVPRLLACADLYVLVSRREGLSLSLLEAMAHGLPVVVTDLPENLEAVGETGIAVSVHDEPALAAALRRLGENASERAALGEAARRRVAELFGAEAMIRRTRAIYDSARRSVA